MENSNVQGTPCDPNSNCAAFKRVSYSLIEEPEVCEWCIYFDEDHAMCVKDSKQKLIQDKAYEKEMGYGKVSALPYPYKSCTKTVLKFR